MPSPPIAIEMRRTSCADAAMASNRPKLIMVRLITIKLCLTHDGYLYFAVVTYRPRIKSMYRTHGPLLSLDEQRHRSHQSKDVHFVRHIHGCRRHVLLLPLGYHYGKCIDGSAFQPLGRLCY